MSTPDRARLDGNTECASGLPLLRVPAKWTDDCQGKKDYDATLVSLSTRYWPSGGGFHVFTREGGLEGNESRPDILPSAHATIYLGSCDNEHYDAAQPLVELKCEAETEDAVKKRVETWTTLQFARIQRALVAEFITVDAAARSDVPRLCTALLEAVEALEKVANDVCGEVLMNGRMCSEVWPKNHVNWCPRCTARRVLTRIQADPPHPEAGGTA